MKKGKQVVIWSVLFVTFFVVAFSNTCEANDTAKRATEYLKVVSARDFEKLFNWTYIYQIDVDKIKAQYRGAKQEKKIEEYYLEAKEEFTSFFASEKPLDGQKVHISSIQPATTLLGFSVRDTTLGTWRPDIINAILIDNDYRKRWVGELAQELKKYQPGQESAPFLELASEIFLFSEGYPELEKYAEEIVIRQR